MSTDALFYCSSLFVIRLAEEVAAAQSISLGLKMHSAAHLKDGLDRIDSLRPILRLKNRKREIGGLYSSIK